MNRRLTYPGELPAALDILDPQVFSLEALSNLAWDVLLSHSNPSSATTKVLAAGFKPSFPGGHQIRLDAGRVYAMLPVDATPFGVAGTNPNIVLQQGQSDGVTLTFDAAPTTAGHSRIDLVQVALVQQDENFAVLPYYNSADPEQPLPGPSGSGESQPLDRVVRAQVTIKKGVAGASPVAPSPDAGNAVLFHVTRAQGNTVLAAGNVSVPATANFIGGLTNKHHTGAPGSAPKIDLTDEVTGTLPVTSGGTGTTTSTGTGSVVRSASPALTGTPTAPTATATTNTTQIATTAFVKTAIDNHHEPDSADHDDRYYTETEIDDMVDALDNAIAGKSDSGHTHDGRYYTETEVDTLLSGKSDSDHNHDTTYEKLANKGQASGYASLGADGKVPSSQLPDRVLPETYVVASQSAMLALTANKGDMAVRTDVNKTFILKATPASTLANWQEMLTPTDSVTSVNTKQGAVVLNTDDIGEGSTNKYFTDARAEAVAEVVAEVVADDRAAELLAANNKFTGRNNSFKGLYAETVTITRLPLMDPLTHEFDYGAGDPPVLARTGPATYIAPDGLKTAGDGQARIGLPWVVRRNLIPDSLKLTTSWLWRGTAARTYGHPDPFGGTDAILATGLGALGVNDVFTSPSLSLAAGARHEPSIYVKRVSTSGALNISNPSGGASGAWSVNLALLGDGWQKVTRSHPAVTINAEFIGHGAGTGGLHITATSGTSVYLFNPQLEPGTASTPPQPTNATGPDLTHPLNGAGLVLEGGGRNYLDNPSLASSTGTLATGWSSDGGTALTCVNGEQAFTATAQFKAITKGVTFDAPTGPLTISAEVTGEQFVVEAYLYDAADVYLGNVTTGRRSPSGFTYVYATTNLTNVKRISFRVTDNRASGWTPIKFRKPQVEISPFPTSWMDGTRQPDLAGIVPPHNLAKYSQDFSRSAWVQNAAGSLTSTTATAPDGTPTAGTINMAAGAGAGVNQTIPGITFDGTAKTFPIWLKGALGGEAMVIGLARSDTGAMVSQTAITLTNTWQRYYVTTTSAAGQGLQLRLARSSTSGSFHFWGAQLNYGSMPGIYVPTTDTPIPAPVSPALDPAWQQNGRMKVRILPPPISTGKHIAYLGYFANGSNYTESPLCLARPSSQLLNGYGLIYERRHSGGSQARGLIQPQVQVLWDGAPHDVILEWTNEINEATGIREMWQRLYIDGTLVAQQDVAALYGATAWAEIDPSRLISDGNVFATISNLELQYPAVALPAL